MTRTPYDTGKRAEPKVWTSAHIEADTDYGKVDFDDDAGGTIATLYIEKDDDGTYALRGYTNEPLKADFDDQSGSDQAAPYTIAPTEALQEKVRNTIAELPTEHEREAEVYWSDNNCRALILVPGEKHVRKQLLITVTDLGELDSAIVKDWAGGIRDTRVG